MLNTGKVSEIFYLNDEFLKELALIFCILTEGMYLVSWPKSFLWTEFISLQGRLILRKRVVIGSVNDELKNVC